MKHVFLFTILLQIPKMAVADGNGTCGDNLTWSYDEATKTLTISGTGTMTDYKLNSTRSTSPWNNYSSDIEKIILEAGISSIGSYAFYKCSGISSIAIPQSIISIGESAFLGCSNLSALTIPNSVISIGTGAFRYCSGLISLNLANGVAFIGERAFQGCSGLTSLTIPNSVTTIGHAAFWDCNLTSVHITDLEAWCKITFVSNPLGEAEHLFLNGKEIKDLIIPNSITAIGEQAFVGGSGLTSIVIPNSVKSVNTSSFYGCSGLTSVIIPNSVTFIGDAAFYGCHGLGSVVISENMTSIGNNAFADCPKLTDVYCLAESVPSTKNRTFGDIVVSDVTLHVPAASVNAYKVADLWKYFKRIIAIGDDAILETPKCANPTITNNDGVVSFSCETEGVEFVSEIKSNDNRKEFDNKIFLNNTYTISVYATKPGFENSDIVTMEVVGTGGINGDLNGDGAVDVGDHVELTNIIMGKTK